MKITNTNWRAALTAAIASSFLVACGGGGGGDSGGGGGGAAPKPPAPTVPTVPTVPTTPTTPVEPVPPVTPGPVPAATGDIALDGAAWFNYRRSQFGASILTTNPMISTAAKAHSNYLSINNLKASHNETPGLPGFTGVEAAPDRLAAAGYLVNGSNSNAFGEVLSGAQSTSGRDMAEELVTAIYHRFVIFEPIYKEFGSGAATTAAGFSFFTTDFAANNGFGQGLGIGQLAVWPFSGQTDVARNFFSDNEVPDPVPEAGVNEVGFPISVHADRVQGTVPSVLEPLSFTVRPRGGTDLPVKLLQHKVSATAIDPETPDSAVAIVPLAPLAAGTTYDVMFVGKLNGNPVARSWSFTTK